MAYLLSNNHIIKDIYIAQVRKGHKCAMSADMRDGSMVMQLSVYSYHLHLANTMSLVVLATRRTTLGDRAFPVAAARAWNDLPPMIKASMSLLTFHQQLKIFLFLSTSLTY